MLARRSFIKPTKFYSQAKAGSIKGGGNLLVRYTRGVRKELFFCFALPAWDNKVLFFFQVCVALCARQQR